MMRGAPRNTAVFTVPSQTPASCGRLPLVFAALGCNPLAHIGSAVVDAARRGRTSRVIEHDEPSGSKLVANSDLVSGGSLSRIRAREGRIGVDHEVGVAFVAHPAVGAVKGRSLGEVVQVPDCKLVGVVLVDL